MANDLEVQDDDDDDDKRIRDTVLDPQMFLQVPTTGLSTAARPEPLPDEHRRADGETEVQREGQD